MDVCPEDFTSRTAPKAGPNLAEQVWTLSNERPKAASDMEAEFNGFLHATSPSAWCVLLSNHGSRIGLVK